MVTRPHSSWLAHTQGEAGGRDRNAGEKNEMKSNLTIFIEVNVLMPFGSYGIYVFFFKCKRSLSIPPKISVSFQADRSFFPVAPSRPHCPWFLNPSTHLCFQILLLYLFCASYIYVITVLFLNIAPEGPWAQSEVTPVPMFCSTFPSINPTAHLLHLNIF